MALNILALEPYYGGSHKAFLENWIAHSRHRWDVLKLPAENWKSRIRYSAFHFASELRKRQAPDLLFCSDLINLAELKSLASPCLDSIPIVLYFHENQFTYPVQPPNQIDKNLAFHNLTSAAVATDVWWNSKFNLSEFLEAANQFVSNYTEYNFPQYLAEIQSKSRVHYPAVDLAPPPLSRMATPTICWAARWEYDKGPQLFFRALEILHRDSVNFKVNVMGEPGSYELKCFARAKAKLGDHINRWGYQPTRQDYLAGLAESDFFVSTAKHEFFGISVCEAVLCGAFPVLPKRLAYPEVMQLKDFPERERHFYSGDAVSLALRLKKLIQQRNADTLWQAPQSELIDTFERYQMSQCAASMDAELERLTET